MRFNTIKLKESGEERLIIFSEGNNLIHSTKNSRGKTTLLRILLYSIGFNIPSTKNIKFENCEIEVNITTDNGETISLIRNCIEYILLEKEEERIKKYEQETDNEKKKKLEKEMAEERNESQNKISALQQSVEVKVKEYENELRNKNQQNEKSRSRQSKILMNNSGGSVTYSDMKSKDKSREAESQFEENEEKKEE